MIVSMGFRRDRREGTMAEAAVAELVFPHGTVLHACGAEGRALLAAHWTVTSYPARSVIVSEQDEDEDVFFVLTGRARAATFTESGREVLLSDLVPGEAFGIFAALDHGPRSTNVLALEDSRVARMSGSRFEELFYAHRAINRAFVLYMIARIRDLSVRITSATTESAAKRLIRELLRLAENEARGGDRAEIRGLPTQQELAALLFTQREVVGRELSRLRRAGLVERAGRTLRIRSLAALRRLLEAD